MWWTAGIRLFDPRHRAVDAKGKKMEEFDSDNHERPIETYPGFIGMTMDYDFFPERQLRCLSNINWNRYTALREWVLDDHTIEALKLPMIPVGTVPAPQQSMYSSSPMTLVKKN